MKGWRDIILGLFGEPIPVLSFIADPDVLLCDELIQKELKDKGVEIIEYKDAVPFRLLFEKSYKEALLKNLSRFLVRVESETLDSIPYDMLVHGQRYVIGVGQLFPKLSTPVIKKLDKGDFDSVFENYSSFTGTASDSDTIEFILKKVYKVQYESILDKTDLFKFLLSKHYKNRKYPDVIDNFLAEKLSKVPSLSGLPLYKLIESVDFFYKYLQEEWGSFIDVLLKEKDLVQESTVEMVCKTHSFPFYDGDVRRLVDNLFLEGKLTPVNVNTDKNIPKWVEFGTVIDYAGAERVRLFEKIFYLSEKLAENMNYKDWVNAAFVFSEIKEMSLKYAERNDNELDANIQQLEKQIDQGFESWMLSNYGTLMNMPYLPMPVMLQQVPHYLSHKHHKKLALVVLDCMSLMQWAQLKERMRDKFDYEQHAVFAWVPTITSISRQSIFIGEMPAYYSSSINTTAKESNHWQLFWENHGILKMYVDYKKVSNPSEKVADIQLKPTNKVLAVVIDTIDELVHSAIQGYQGLHAEMKIWLDSGYIIELVNKLLENDYEVYLISDHGNKECIGTGKVSEGVLAHTRGERVRVYSSRTLRDEAAQNHESIPWDSSGLPKDMFALVAKNGNAFIAENEKVVSHGGMSLEEVVVPFIKIQKKQERKKA